MLKTAPEISIGASGLVAASQSAEKDAAKGNQPHTGKVRLQYGTNSNHFTVIMWFIVSVLHQVCTVDCSVVVFVILV